MTDIFMDLVKIMNDVFGDILVVSWLPLLVIVVAGYYVRKMMVKGG